MTLSRDEGTVSRAVCVPCIDPSGRQDQALHGGEIRPVRGLIWLLMLAAARVRTSLEQLEGVEPRHWTQKKRLHGDNELILDRKAGDCAP